MPQQKKKRFRVDKKLVFYIVLSALPILQFCIFYIGVNFNVILLAFKKYDYDTGKYGFAGWQNIKQVFSDFSSTPYYKTAVVNSLLACFVTVAIGTTLALLFAYYLHIKGPASGLFRVVLFLPTIISSVAFIIVFKYFAEMVIPEICNKLFHAHVTGLLTDRHTRLGTLLVFGVWIGFGVPVLMYTGAMSGIPVSVSESAKLDGVSPVKEFWHITLPMIYPTIVTFFIVNMATIFQNQLNAYGFFDQAADYDVYTVGYFLYSRTVSGTIADYPYLSAIGVILTVILVPITMTVRWLMERFGPRTD